MDSGKLEELGYGMIVRRPYPIPKVVDVLQKLEGICHIMSLDLDMGNHIVWLDPD